MKKSSLTFTFLPKLLLPIICFYLSIILGLTSRECFQLRMALLLISRCLNGLMTTDLFLGLWFFSCSVFKNLFMYVDKIQVPPPSFWLIRMLGTNSENRTVPLDWSYLFQTYDNSIIDIFITVSESFNSSPWDKASQYSEYLLLR